MWNKSVGCNTAAAVVVAGVDVYVLICRLYAASYLCAYIHTHVCRFVIEEERWELLT